MRPTFLKGAVVGGITGTLCAAGAVALAGTGIGAVFNLGKTNSVDAQSVLKGQPANGDTQLVVQNTGTGRGVAAASASANGLYAKSVSGIGVAADSNSGVGAAGNSPSNQGAVHGESTKGDGVFGLSLSATAAGVRGVDTAGDFGVRGRSASTGPGIRGTSVNGHGVEGRSSSSQGVFGASSQSAAAVIGESGAADAVVGTTHSGQGLAGRAVGVDGEAPNGGNGVYGEGKIGVIGETVGGGGAAFLALGNATQNRTGGGWIKAMAYIDPFQADPIRQCYNSALAPDKAQAGDCGLTYSHSGALAGVYFIDFGFAVYDRPVVVTPVYDGGDIGAELLHGASASEQQVRTFYSSVGDSGNDAELTDAPFYIVVY
jgi:hypothetical protein